MEHFTACARGISSIVQVSHMDGLVLWPPGAHTIADRGIIPDLTAAVPLRHMSLDIPENQDAANDLNTADYQHYTLLADGIPHLVMATTTCDVCVPPHPMGTTMQLHHLPAPVVRDGLARHTVHAWVNLDIGDACEKGDGPLKRFHIIGWSVTDAQPQPYTVPDGEAPCPTMGVTLTLGDAGHDHPGLPYSLGGFDGQPDPYAQWMDIVTDVHDHRVPATPAG